MLHVQKSSLGNALTLSLDDLLAPAAEFLGQAEQALATRGLEGLRVHVVLHFLYALLEMSWGLMELVVSKVIVKETANVCNGRLMWVDVANFTHHP